VRRRALAPAMRGSLPPEADPRRPLRDEWSSDTSSTAMPLAPADELDMATVGDVARALREGAGTARVLGLQHRGGPHTDG
jgi:hypothetical protein